MADVNALVRAMKKAALDAMESMKPVTVLFGRVQSVEPLQINVEQKMLLGAAQLILARNVTDYTATVTVQWETENHEIGHRHSADGEDTGYAEIPHAHEIKGKKTVLVHNALEVGDQVILIRQQEGQKFVVIDRIGGTA